MHRSIRRLLGRALPLAAVLSLAVVCAAPAGALTDPSTWVPTFCTATLTWGDGTSAGLQSLADSANNPSATAAQNKQAIIQFVETALASTKAFGTAMTRAGAPKVTNGVKIQAAILAGITGTAANLAAMGKVAHALPTRSQKVFDKAATSLSTRLSTIDTPFKKGLQKVGSLDKTSQLNNLILSTAECAPLITSTTTTPTTGG